MVVKHYGKTVPLEYLRQKAQYSKEGVSMLGLAEAAVAIGFKTVDPKLTIIPAHRKPSVLISVCRQADPCPYLMIAIFLMCMIMHPAITVVKQMCGNNENYTRYQQPYLIAVKNLFH
jgi:ABC-type bacteriocin/lantibiotic exporter with double-glycine peptidase domain